MIGARLFGTRSRIAAVAATVTAVAVAYGLAVNHYIRTTADDVGLNFWLIVVWVTLTMVSSACQVVLAADLLWGERWRRQAILGWVPDPDDVRPEDLKERRWPLILLFVVLMSANYGGNESLTGRFHGWYQFRGFALVQARSPDPAQRLEALEDLGDHDDPEIVGRVREMVEDPDPAVRAEALGIMGDKSVDEARPVLFRALEGADEGLRVVAAEALGKLRGEGVLQALSGQLSRNPPPALRQAALAGLGLLGDPAAVPLVQSHLRDAEAPDEVRAVAAWAMGELKPPDAATALTDTIDRDTETVARCAALHALAKVMAGHAPAVPDRVKAAFLAGRGKEGHPCPRAFVTQRAHDRCFGKLNRPSDVPYEGVCVKYQISSPERFRVKMVRAMARGAGKASMPWLAEVNGDESEPPGIRSWAGELYLQLKAM